MSSSHNWFQKNLGESKKFLEDPEVNLYNS